MAELGDLTKTGWLYEANYDEWSDRMCSMLHFTGYVSDCYGSCDLDCLRNEERHSTPRVFLLEVLDIIQKNVSPAFLERIPDEDKTDFKRLLDKLEAHACSFRFLDLSPEIRKRIHDHVVTDALSWNDEWVEITHDGEFELTRQPLLAVSRQIRDEVMPLYLTKARFRLCSPPDNSWPVGTVAKAISAWAESTLKQHARHLDLFDLPLTQDDYLTLTCTPKDGLKVNIEARLRAQDERKLRKHVAAIETSRKALGLGGEAIILTLTSRPALWDPGVLQMLPDY